MQQEQSESNHQENVFPCHAIHPTHKQKMHWNILEPETTRNWGILNGTRNPSYYATIYHHRRDGPPVRLSFIGDRQDSAAQAEHTRPWPCRAVVHDLLCSLRLPALWPTDDCSWIFIIIPHRPEDFYSGVLNPVMAFLCFHFNSIPPRKKVGINVRWKVLPRSQEEILKCTKESS